VGAVVTLEPPGDSPADDLPWIVTFGPLDEDEDWEPVVCGPYERPHALGLAQAIVLDDEDLMAVVEPLLPRVSTEEIRRDISEARRDVAERLAGSAQPDEPTTAGGDTAVGPGAASGDEPLPSAPPPSPQEVRAGLARIAARLTS
jgi:hypothetical protein